MRLQLELNPITKIMYLTALKLKQPFNLSELTFAFQSLYPKWTKKNTRFRIKQLIQQKLISKQYINFKIYYICLVSTDDFLSAEFISNSSKDFYSKNFLICQL